MKLIKWLYFTRVIKNKRRQVWDAEFKKRYLGEIREGVRVDYDRVREMLDGVTRRMCMEKYVVMYTGDEKDTTPMEYDIRNLPLSPAEIEALPDKPTEGNRYYKTLKEKVDQGILDQLASQAAQLTKQVEGMQGNIKRIDSQIEGPLFDEQGSDQSLNGTIDGLMTLISILKQHRKSL